MRATDVRLPVLEKAELFGALTASDRATLAVCLRGLRFDAGETVLREGDPGSTLLVIAEGELVATATGADHNEQILNRMGPNEVVGEMAFLDPGPCSATVRAVTDAVVYELSRDAMDVLRQRAPGAVSAIVAAATRDVTRRLRNLDERIERELERLGVPVVASEER